MVSENRKSILVSYRVNDPGDDKNDPAVQEIAVFNARLSGMFEALLRAAPRFQPETLRDDGFALITGPHVRSPEVGLTVRNYFLALQFADWDKYKSVCIDDVKLSCSEHDTESENYEQTLTHTVNWRRGFDRIEFKFPYASIGTQFAVINFDYQLFFDDYDDLEQSNVPFKQGNNWMMFNFNAERLITRIAHAAPEEFTDRIHDMRFYEQAA